MQERQLEQAKDMQRAQTEYIKSVAGDPRRVPTDQIMSARACSTAATITQAEFDQIKAKALAA